jgi:hypothetical protein
MLPLLKRVLPDWLMLVLLGNVVGTLLVFA